MLNPGDIALHLTFCSFISVFSEDCKIIAVPARGHLLRMCLIWLKFLSDDENVYQEKLWGKKLIVEQEHSIAEREKNVA